MNLKISKSQAHSNRLFHLYLLILGISIGVVSTLCLKSFSFTIPSIAFSLPASISYNTSLTFPFQKPTLPPATISNGTSSSSSSNDTIDDHVVSLKYNNNTGRIGPLTHNMSDDELLLRAAKVEGLVGSGPHKVAFMFLTPGPLHLAPFWDRFFKGHEGLYSIYVHPHPSYSYPTPKDSAFYGTSIPSQPVYWGTISMIDAERRLLANALLDPSNKRFALLSDSCIPLNNFTTTYNFLMGTNESYMSLFDDPRKPGRGRYNRQMWPNITIEQWRKGSQWFEIHRDLAVKIVADTKYYPIFRDFCHPPCYNDEHYLPTLVNILYPEMNSNRTVTFVDWSRGGPHPRRFGWGDVSVELLDNIRYGYECMYNGKKTNMCHLFARKFLPNCLGPLLKIAPLLGFNP